MEEKKDEQVEENEVLLVSLTLCLFCLYSFEFSWMIIGIKSIFKSYQLALYAFSLHWHDWFENLYYYIVLKSTIYVLK